MPDSDRRGFLNSISSWFMMGGLATSYGACSAMGGRYLFPSRPRNRRWQYVARLAEVAVGASLTYRAPSGERVAIARRADTGTAEDFVALSSTCPHLGCQVHWEGANERFFCPCHNGAFDLEGAPIEGPPAEAGQSLPRYPLQVRSGLLFIEVPMESLAAAESNGARVADAGKPDRQGHDPCLKPGDGSRRS